MLKSIEDLIHFGNGMFLDYIYDLISYQFPNSTIEHFIVPTLLNSREKVNRLCFRKVDKIISNLGIYISLKNNVMFFMHSSYSKKYINKISSISLDEIKDMNDLFKILSENIIITEKE